MKLKCRIGQSLIEVVVSVGIAVILAIALISAGLVSNKTARSARNNTQATKLAEEGIERIRVFRDRKGYSALALGACYTLDTSAADPVMWSLVTTDCPAGEAITLENVEYKRKYVIEDVSTAVPVANKRRITTTVTWNDSSGVQTVTNYTILSEWTAP